MPHGGDWAALKPLLPVFFSYVLSFVYVAIYWNNHHHMFHAVEHIDGSILWANAHLLFWLSLLPFCAAWVGEHGFQTAPVALYGIVFSMCGVAYIILTFRLLRLHAADSLLAKALQSGIKEKASLALDALGIAFAFVDMRISLAVYVFVAAMWLLPDRRIEKKMIGEH